MLREYVFVIPSVATVDVDAEELVVGHVGYYEEVTLDLLGSKKVA
jgi:hypothetical protein